MNRSGLIIVFVGALLIPGAAFAGAVKITDGTGITIPEEAPGAGGDAYFGLKGQENPFARLRDKVGQYWTPNFNGLNARIAYISESDAASFAGLGAISPASAGSLSFSLNYQYGQASAFVGNESDWSSVSFGVARSANQVGASYDFASGTKFGVGYGQLRYNFLAGSPGMPNAGGIQMNDWYFSLAQDVGTSGQVRFSVLQADAATAGGMGVQGSANQLSLGYGHALSNRTEIYALYTRTNNSYNFATSPFGLGAGLSTFGLGVKHSF
ncbi:MAG: porin [Burkholderiales bacterium]